MLDAFDLQAQAVDLAVAVFDFPVEGLVEGGCAVGVVLVELQRLYMLRSRRRHYIDKLIALTSFLQPSQKSARAPSRLAQLPREKTALVEDLRTWGYYLVLVALLKQAAALALVLRGLLAGEFDAAFSAAPVSVAIVAQQVRCQQLGARAGSVPRWRCILSDGPIELLGLEDSTQNILFFPPQQQPGY